MRPKQVACVLFHWMACSLNDAFSCKNWIFLRPDQITKKGFTVKLSIFKIKNDKNVMLIGRNPKGGGAWVECDLLFVICMGTYLPEDQ